MKLFKRTIFVLVLGFLLATPVSAFAASSISVNDDYSFTNSGDTALENIKVEVVPEVPYDSSANVLLSEDWSQMTFDSVTVNFDTTGWSYSDGVFTYNGKLAAGATTNKLITSTSGPDGYKVNVIVEALEAAETPNPTPDPDPGTKVDPSDDGSPLNKLQGLVNTGDVPVILFLAVLTLGAVGFVAFKSRGKNVH